MVVVVEEGEGWDFAITGWRNMVNRQYVLVSRTVDDFFADVCAFLFSRLQLLNVISSENYKTLFLGHSAVLFFFCCENVHEVTKSICETGALSTLILCFFVHVVFKVF